MTARLCATLLLCLVHCGCTGDVHIAPPGVEHPASIDAPAAPVHAPSPLLSDADPVVRTPPATPPGGAAHQGHAALSSHEHGDASMGHGEASMQQNGAEPNDEAAAPLPAAYVCPMHPEVISPQPGRCPKCGMQLVQVKDQP